MSLGESSEALLPMLMNLPGGLSIPMPTATGAETGQHSTAQQTDCSLRQGARALKGP